MAVETACDCGDTFDSNNISKAFDSIFLPSAGNYLRVVSGIPGMTGNCLNISGGVSNSAYFQENFQNLATRSVGTRVNIGGGVLSNNMQLIGILDTGTLQVGFSAMSDGSIRAFLGSFSLGGGTQLCASNPGIVAAGTTFYLAISVTCATSATGSVAIYVNDILVASAVNVITATSGAATSNQVRWACIGGTDFYYDDIQVFNSTGGDHTGVPLAAGIKVGLPSGAGRYTQMTANGAGANWQCVDSVVTNTLATYVSAATSPLKDAYAMTFPSVGNLAYCVTQDCAQTSDGGAASLTPGFSNGSTDGSGSAISIPSSFKMLRQAFGTNPITSAAWATGDLTTLQKLIARTA